MPVKLSTFPLKVSAKMQFKYDEYKLNNTQDGYSGRCVELAEDWAHYIEEESRSGKPFTKEVMDKCMSRADYDGITGYMYGAAASILANFWVHAALFQKVYNGQFLTEEECNQMKPGQVVNPALITVTIPG